MTVEAARGKASELNSKLSNWKTNDFKGDNPLKRHARADLTLGQLTERYIERRVRQKATDPEEAEKELRWMFDKHLAQWRNRKLDQIRRPDVRDLHERMGRGSGKVIADRVVQLIRRLYFWAMSGKVELFSGENPATKIELNGYKKRERFLQPDELVRIDRALKQDTNRDFRDFIELALATGARRGNVLGMEWAALNELSEELWVWTITKTKTGKPYVLPLTPRAIAVLKRRSHMRESSPWVFPSPQSKTGHLVEPKKPWKRLLRRAAIQDFTIHDLRRTNASYQSIAGSTLQAIAKTLGHASTISTEIYAKLNIDVARASLLAGDRMMEAAKDAASKKANGAA